MRKFVIKGKAIGDIVYKTKNICIESIQGGINNNDCYIIGTGYSLSVVDNNVVSLHDPFMNKFSININKNVTVFSFYFTFDSNGLDESSKDLASFVNSIGDRFKRIFLIGHSKCGLCCYNASHYCLKDIFLVTISTPFRGTYIADKNYINKKFNGNILYLLYDKIFSNHNVDKDIIPDSKFINELKNPRYIEHINIISQIEKISNCRSLEDFFLLFFDKSLNLNGDGIVSYESQLINSSKTINLKSSHAHSLELGIRELEKLNNDVIDRKFCKE